MKKAVSLLLAVLLTISLAACGGKNTVAEDTTETAAPTEAAEVQQSADGIDIDLTQMSSTMVYSEVQNMMMNPNDYVGKIVKMSGAFTVSETEDNRYFACIIKDATACCAQGIEFDWQGDHSYPEDYPEQGTDITVTGAFSTYREDLQIYCQLQNAEVVF